MRGILGRSALNTTLALLGELGNAERKKDWPVRGESLNSVRIEFWEGVTLVLTEFYSKNLVLKRPRPDIDIHKGELPIIWWLEQLVICWI